MDEREYDFSGETYEPEFDRTRLNRQLRSVLSIVRDSEWRTLQEIAEATGEPEASISARLRDLRKERFGGHTVLRRRVGSGGTFEYRLVVASPRPARRIRPYTGED